MINNNELRKGNWVIDLDESFKQISSGADIDGIWEPIKIEPDVLVKAGFEDTNPRFAYDKYRKANVVLIRKPSSYMVNLTGAFGMVTIQEISFVHQLQNLIYTITGTELIIHL